MYNCYMKYPHKMQVNQTWFQCSKVYMHALSVQDATMATCCHKHRRELNFLPFSEFKKIECVSWVFILSTRTRMLPAPWTTFAEQSAKIKKTANSIVKRHVYFLAILEKNSGLTHWAIRRLGRVQIRVTKNMADFHVIRHHCHDSKYSSIQRNNVLYSAK